MRRVAPHLINRKIRVHPVPTAAMLELTERCNLRCGHCIRDCPAPVASAGSELTSAGWLGIIDDLASIDAFSVCFTGGEPLLVPELADLAARARSRRLAVAVKTNGLLLAERAAELARAGVGMFEVTLTGASATTHEKTTGISGSFERTCAGVRAARALGLPVTLTFTLFRWNAAEVEAMRALADRLGCAARRDYFLIPSDCGRAHDDAFLTPEQIRQVEACWPGSTVLAEQNGAGGLKSCMQGLNSLTITALGDVLSCVAIRRPLGNVRAEPLSAIWRRSTGLAAGPFQPPHGIDYGRCRRCLECDLVERCFICPGQNLAATGDFHEPPLERCLVTMALYGELTLKGGAAGCASMASRS